MTQVELNTVIERHKHWLNRDCEGWENMRANLKDTNLKGLNLAFANLSKADLSNVNLALANLYYADLSEANLSKANLIEANLIGANLNGADLRNAYLNYALLKGADFVGANLKGAYSQYAILSNARLVRANLEGADLEYANLSEADLDDSEKCRQGMILTEPIKGYKKTAEGNVIELEIPEGAIVFSINNNNCRTNKAIVKKCEGVQHSWFNSSFEYREGDTIEVEEFNMQYNAECVEGIHFFRTKEEAEKYEIDDLCNRKDV